MIYRLVMKDKKGLRIGLKRYTKENAEKRIKELLSLGIHMQAVCEANLFS